MPQIPDEFPLNDGLIYLNHAAVGVWPKRTCEAVNVFAWENMRQGAADYPRWLHVERELRDRLKRLVNAVSRDDIALVKNTSEGLSLLAYGLDWRSGDKGAIQKSTSWITQYEMDGSIMVGAKREGQMQSPRNTRNTRKKVKTPPLFSPVDLPSLFRVFRVFRGGKD